LRASAGSERMDCRRHPLRTYVRILVKLGVSAPGRGPFLLLASAVGRMVRSMVALDRVHERRRAVALARHYRDEEGLSIAEIARRLGRAEATVKAYL
jgi:Sigma-70, region 4